jgi:hypothetical protein
MDGARSGPLEDSAGFPRYEEVLNIVADPKHPDHVECAQWVALITRSDNPFLPGFLDVPTFNLKSSDLIRSGAHPVASLDRSRNWRKSG